MVLGVADGQGGSLPEDVEPCSQRVLLAADCSELAVADALEACRLYECEKAKAAEKWLSEA
jgi:hypothetical protein